MVHKKVKFKGEVYWLHTNEMGSSDYNLSPLDHYDEEGDLIADPFTAISYAVVEDGVIMRYGSPIGTMADLEDI